MGTGTSEQLQDISDLTGFPDQRELLQTLRIKSKKKTKSSPLEGAEQEKPENPECLDATTYSGNEGTIAEGTT